MEQKLLDNLEVVIRVHTQRKCSLRMAAYVIAVERIMEAIQYRGIYP
jgi:glutamate dehydrogenase (NAD(P)+)